MKRQSKISDRMSLSEMMQAKEAGEQVVTHVLDDVREPKVDFEKMQKIISAPSEQELEPPIDESNKAVS